MNYYLDGRGARIYYGDVARAIRLLHPELVGAGIFEQLGALGLLEEFNKGCTPHSLPRSFTDIEGQQ